MAKPRTRQWTPEQLADMKAAKKRGLHKIDLRKPPSSYGRELARQFRGLSKGLKSIVTVQPQHVDALKKQGIRIKAGKAIIDKSKKSYTVSYSKKTGTIKLFGSLKGERFEVPVVSDISQVRQLKKGEQYRVVWRNQYGTTMRTFASYGNMANYGVFDYETDSDDFDMEIQII